MQNPPILSIGQFRIHLFSLLNGILLGKIYHTMQLRIIILKAVQEKLGQCQAGDLPGTEQRGQLRDGHKGQVGLPAWSGDTLRDFPLNLFSGWRKLETIGKGIKLYGWRCGVGQSIGPDRPVGIHQLSHA